ncbi:MAG: electron transfer flavoprotein subunit beta/FixA family protein [Syntrophaceae bacterium]
MNIVVCIKQVPDTDTVIKVKPDGSGIDETDIKWVMNPYDEFAAEEALRMKEKFGGDVTIVTLGPARALETLRTALAMGADKGIFIHDPVFDNADAYVTATALAAAIKAIPYDIIFCGQRAIDDDSGQVGSILAELLDIPQVTTVTKFDVEGNSIKVIKPIEGAQLLIESSLPCVVTAQKGLNEPRYPSIQGILKARKKPIDIKDAAALDVSMGVKAEVLKIMPPPARSPGKIISGDDPTAKAKYLTKLLREEAKVI